MATIYHHYNPGDSTFECPQNREIADDSPQLKNTVRRLSEQSERRLSEQRRRSSVVIEKTSLLDGIYSMRKGKLPTNEQLNRVMNRLLNSKTIENNKGSLSSDGQLLLKDFQELLAAFQLALQTKNRDELFQSLIYHVRKSEIALDKTAAAADEEQLQSDMKTGAKSILDISKLFLFNSQFRNLLEQILTIAQQTMGGALQQGGKMLDDNAKSSANEISSSYGANKQQDSAVNRKTPQDNQFRNAALGATGGITLADSTGYLALNKGKGDARLLNKGRNEKGISSPSGLQHGPHTDAAHIPVPEEHMGFLSHRFAEPEHGAPIKDDGGNAITEAFDAKYHGYPSRGDFSSNVDHYPHAISTPLPVPYEHLDFLAHRFTEIEHGAPTKDDGGNAFSPEGFDPESNMSTSASGISPRFLRQDDQDNKVDASQFDQSFFQNRLRNSSFITTPTSAADVRYNLNEFRRTMPSDENTDNMPGATSANYADAGPIQTEGTMNRIDQSYTNDGDGLNKDMDTTGTTGSENCMESSQGVDASGMNTVDAGIYERNRDYAQDNLLKDCFSKGPESTQKTSTDQPITCDFNPHKERSDDNMTDGLDSTAGNIQVSSVHPYTSKNHGMFDASEVKDLKNNVSSMNAINQSSTTGNIGQTVDIGATSAGLGAAGTVITDYENQTPNDKDQHPGSTTKVPSQNNQDRSTGDTTISANKMVNKLKTNTNVSRFKDDDMTDQQSDNRGESISANEIISQLKDILTKVQKNPEYQQAISSILSLFNDWGERLKSGDNDAMDRRRSSAVSVSEQKEYYTAVASREAKTIIEDWAQGKPLDPLIEQVMDLASKLKKDGNLQELYKKVLAYTQKLLKEPGYLADDQSTNDGKELVNEVRSSALEKYKREVDSIVQESNNIIRAISEDPNSREISQKIKSIHSHLWYDRNGNAAFKPHLLNDIRITLIPALIEQVKYIPLPQITYSDKQYDIAIENMSLEGDTLMPDVFEVKVDDFLRFSPKANLGYTNSQSMQIHMMGIQTTLDDVVFYYRKKTGFPQLSDSGVVSVYTGGTGVKLSMKIVSSSVDQLHTFRVDQCHCHIDKLDFKVQSSKHNVLYKVFNPVLKGIVKRQMTKAIETKLITTFESGDAKITKHLYATQRSGQPDSNDTRRPSLLSHLINLMSQKVAVI